MILPVCVLLAEQEPSSLEKQRISIRKQSGVDAPGTGFFLTGWLTPTGPMSTAAVTSSEAIAPAPSQGEDCEALTDVSLEKMIADASEKEGVNPKLVKAMIRRESGGKPCAVSVKGAQGLMQIMPATQADLGIRNPFDANENVSAGVRYLKQMLERYQGNTALALAAYNAGPQRVTPGGKIPDIPETQSYVLSILGQLNEQDSSQ